MDRIPQIIGLLVGAAFFAAAFMSDSGQPVGATYREQTIIFIICGLTAVAVGLAVWLRHGKGKDKDE